MTFKLQQANALIIDDYQSMRTMLCDFVRTMGVSQIDTASNGRDAISHLNASKYDIVICDFHLGPGANGQQVLEETKLRGLIGVSTIWIMVTAEKTPEMVMGTAETKPDDYLLKPLNQVLLQSRLQKLIDRKQALGVVEAAIRAKNLAAAIDHCDQLLKAQVASPQEILRIKSDLLLTLGDYAAAKALFESVLASRNVAWAKTGLGKTLLLTQNYADALTLFQQVLADNPMYMEASDWLAKTYEAMGDVAMVQQVLLQAVKLSPNSPLRQKNLGDAALKNGALDLAQAAFEKNIRISEFSAHKSPSVYARLAEVLADKGESQEALTVLKRSRVDFKSNPVAALQAAAVESRIHQKMGHTELALAAMASAEQLVQQLGGNLSTELLMEVAKSHLKLGQEDKASRIYGEVIKNNHEDMALSSQIAALFASEHLEDVGQALIRASRQEVIDINNQGVLLAKQGDFQQGAKLLRSAVKQLPASEVMLVNLCGLLIAQMNQEGFQQTLASEAKDLLDRVHALNPASTKYYTYALVLARLQRG